MIKRNKSIWFVLFLLVLIVIKTFLFRFENLDEIWHYNLCRGITLGYLPYRDINLVGMPLYYFIFSLPLFITKKFLVYRMEEALLIFICSLLLYLIVKSECGFGYAAITALVSCMFTDITSYNNLLFLFVILLYLLNKHSFSFKRNMILGILTGLAVWSRQTSGFITIIAETIYLIVESRKTSKKGLLSFAGGFIGVNLIFLIYLLCASSFFAFWDYCFFGLSSYSNILEGTDPWGILMVIIVVLILITEGILMLKKNLLRTTNHVLLTIALLTIAIPTVDMTHSIFAFFLAMIPFMSIVKQNIRIQFKPLLGFGTAAVLIFTIARGLIPMFSDISFESNCQELDLIPTNGSESGYISINNKNRTYKAQGYDVVVLSSCSAIISIYDGTFNPPYDLFLVGSFGTQDPVELIDDLCHKDTVIIVIPDDYNEENWMNPDGIYECVIKNCKPIDRIGRFAYYIPDNG